MSLLSCLCGISLGQYCQKSIVKSGRFCGKIKRRVVCRGRRRCWGGGSNFLHTVIDLKNRSIRARRFDFNLIGEKVLRFNEEIMNRYYFRNLFWVVVVAFITFLIKAFLGTFSPMLPCFCKHKRFRFGYC